MVIKYILLALIGMGAGAVTAAGYFAVIAAVGVVTRFAEYTKTAAMIRVYEVILCFGAIIGNILIVFQPDLTMGEWLLAPIGLLCGIFTGCFLLSLAEAVKGLPVFLRKSKIQKGISLIIIALALGKTIGSIYFFCCYFATN